MTTTIPTCPQCSMENTYPDGENFVCADCGHEWPKQQAAATDDDRYAAGHLVQDAARQLVFFVHRQAGGLARHGQHISGGHADV